MHVLRPMVTGAYTLTSFIPSRDGSDIQAAYQLIPDMPSTPRSRHRSIDSDAHAEEANGTYSMLLSSELLGSDALVSPKGSPSPSRSSTAVLGSPSGRRNRDSPSLPTTPSKRNLLSFKSPPSNTSTPRSRDQHSRLSRDLSAVGAHLEDAGDVRREDGLFGGRSAASTTPSSTPTALFSPGDVASSPTHSAYSTSPVRPESERLLLAARKPTRTLSKVPFKVLDAPELAVRALLTRMTFILIWWTGQARMCLAWV